MSSCEQEFWVVVRAQEEGGKAGKFLTAEEDGTPKPIILNMGGPTLEARVDAVEKAVIAQMALDKKYEPKTDRVPLVRMLPFSTAAAITQTKK